jgi:hypothetical protein
MNEPKTANDYSDRDVRAARSVLIELGQVLGEWRDGFVVVGGAVPWLLLDSANPQHIGTLDIDLDLNPEVLAEGAYANLVHTLENKGYERRDKTLKPFQLRRSFKLDEGDPVTVLVDLLMPRNKKGDRNQKKLVAGLKVQGADGGSVPLVHNQKIVIHGAMPDGRRNSVELRVATIPALLVMKGYAIVGRDKKKDAYDIFFSVRNFAGGPQALAHACKPLLSDSEAHKGYENIASKFRDLNDYGPASVRMFLEDSAGLAEMTSEQVQTDAFMQVSSWLHLLGLKT